MRTPLLGNSGIAVSVLCLGCMNFDTCVSDNEAFDLLDGYWEAGGRFIDTANNTLSGAGRAGQRTESVVGEWLRDRGCRNEAIVATKVGALPSVPDAGIEAAEGACGAAVVAAVEKSLQRLKIDRINYATPTSRIVVLSLKKPCGLGLISSPQVRSER